MLCLIFFPIFVLELAIISWLLITILDRLEKLEHHKCHHPVNPCKPF